MPHRVPPSPIARLWTSGRIIQIRTWKRVRKYMKRAIVSIFFSWILSWIPIKFLTIYQLEKTFGYFYHVFSSLHASRPQRALHLTFRCYHLSLHHSPLTNNVKLCKVLNFFHWIRWISFVFKLHMNIFIWFTNFDYLHSGRRFWSCLAFKNVGPRWRHSQMIFSCFMFLIVFRWHTYADVSVCLQCP